MSETCIEKGLSVGGIVKVTDEDSEFFDLQGVIIEIIEDGDPDGQIGVKFPTWYQYLFDYNDQRRTVRFHAPDLKVEECFNMPTDIYMKCLFGEMGVWTISSPQYPLIPGNTDCMHAGCKRKAWFKIFYNCWGNATEFYVCPEHAHYHGVCGDGFPVKKNWK